MSGGELFEYISEKEALSEEEASAFIKQILEGVKHLHEHHIVHLDLKPENIMLLDRNSTKIKLIDFGLARKIMDKEDVRAMMGTAEFIGNPFLRLFLLLFVIYLITKARLSLTDSLTHSITLLSHVPKARHIHSAKIKGLACIS